MRKEAGQTGQIKALSRECIDMIRGAFNFNNAGKLIGYRWRSGVPMTARTQFPRTQHAPSCCFATFSSLYVRQLRGITGFNGG